jgi:hypothetical protein
VLLLLLLLWWWWWWWSVLAFYASAIAVFVIDIN